MSGAPNGLDLVLPVAGRDARRAALCVRSVARFLRGLKTLWLIVPDEQVALFDWALRYPFVKLVRESDLVAPASALHRLTGLASRNHPGWYRQQLIKLEACRLVTSPYYLTLDADVLCTQAHSVDELFEDSRARCVRHELCHPSWYRVAAHLLALPRLRHEYGVTPVLLHAATARAMLDHLGARSRNLHHFIGWTEYALYFTYVEGIGQLDALHRPIPFEAWFGPCAWSDWRPGNPGFSVEEAFAARGGGWFSLISSRCAVPIETIEALVTPYLDA